MCERLITPQLLCLTSTERCCIGTVQWSSLSKSLRYLRTAPKPPKKWISLCGWCCTTSLITALSLPPQQSPHAIQHRRANRFWASCKKCIHKCTAATLWETGCAQGCSSDYTPRNPGVGTEMQNQRVWKCSYGVTSRKSKEMWWVTLGFAAVCAKTTSRILTSLFRFSYLLKYFGIFCSDTKRFSPTKRNSSNKKDNVLLKVFYMFKYLHPHKFY